jgi:cysteinyl-tRNA synthetase
MIAGARVEVAPYKRDPMDFVLWKPSTPEEPGWESPWGRGRPGWHIECSAMAKELLGTAFDIHGGGIDLQFPHHENEIAQSCCADPGAGFAQVWMHNEMVQVEGKKMSKSLGNFFTVRDLLDQGIPGEVIRFVLLSTHYRKPMDWTEERVREAGETLRKWHDLIWDEAVLSDAAPAQGKLSNTPPAALVEALADDLNTPLAIKVLHDLAKSGDWQGLRAGLHVLGINIEMSAVGGDVDMSRDGIAYPGRYEDYYASVRELRDRWQKERLAKNWTAADRIKVDATGAGVELSVTPDGPAARITDNFDPTKLEALK